MVQPGAENQGTGEAPSREASTPSPGGERQSKRLYRSSDQRILLGVCGGLGEYFDIDPTLIRIGFVVLTFVWFTGVLLYIALAIIMPSEEHLEAHPREAARSTIDEAIATTRDAITRASDWVRAKTGAGQPPTPRQEGSQQQAAQERPATDEPAGHEPPAP